MDSFYTRDELKLLGLKAVGENVSLSRKASIYDPDEIELGHHVRIDDFCILSGKVGIGSFVHIAAYTALYGQKGIYIDDYSGLSPRCTVLSASDDFSGNYLMMPTVDVRFRNVTGGSVYIKKYAAIGTSCVIFPSVVIEEGVAVGAMSLINKTLPAWRIYAGIPAKYVKERSRKLLDFLQ